MSSIKRKLSAVVISICFTACVVACAKQDRGGQIIPVKNANYSPIEKILLLGRDKDCSFFKIKTKQPVKYDLLVKVAKDGKWEDAAAKRGVELSDNTYIMFGLNKNQEDAPVLQIGVSSPQNTAVISQKISAPASKVKSVELLGNESTLDAKEIALAHLAYITSAQNDNLNSYAPNHYLDKPAFTGDEYLFVLRRAVD